MKHGAELTIPRGLAGTILVYKLAAALSEQGADLDKVEAVAKYATTRLGTLGIGLDHCHVCLLFSLPHLPHPFLVHKKYTPDD